MWNVFDNQSSSRSTCSESEESPFINRRDTLQVYNCGLPSSVYQRCYPTSMSRRGSVSSLSTFEGSDHPSASGACSNLTEDDRNEKKLEVVKSSKKGDSEGSADSFDDFAISCCYEEECALGLHDLLTQKLEEQITPLLRLAFSSQRSSLIVFPGLATIISNASVDILRMSEEEPYGIRGATIILKLRSQPSQGLWTFKSKPELTEKTLGIIAMDLDTVSTFELTLVLFEEKVFSVALKNWIRSAVPIGQPKQSFVINQNYQINKKKLYR